MPRTRPYLPVDKVPSLMTRRYARDAAEQWLALVAAGGGLPTPLEQRNIARMLDHLHLADLAARVRELPHQAEPAAAATS
jgi:hypothetical protein